MKITYAGQTDVGRKRKHNEDSFQLVPEENLFIVCDGMGGHASGEVASQLAVDTIKKFYDETTQDPERTWPLKEDKNLDFPTNRLVTAVRLANYRVHEQAQTDPAYQGMGTTCVGLLFTDDRIVVAHVGDSRCYRIRNAEIEQITEDHSLLNDYKKMASLTPEEEANFPHKNIIVRALGMKEDVQVDTSEIEVQPGDVYLACSDGLSGEVTDKELLELVMSSLEDLETATESLIDAANNAGGKDNITVVLARVD